MQQSVFNINRHLTCFHIINIFTKQLSYYEPNPMLWGTSIRYKGHNKNPHSEQIFADNSKNSPGSENQTQDVPYKL